jgi:BirA family transcriptional regulator, biotin operon repressor / biotin---[acetyl-CoA-carboxylase] ligase
MSALGLPRLHLRSTGSTNDRARTLAAAGAPHGTVVTTSEQTAGRGRQGRAWSAPPGTSLAMSLVLRPVPELLPLAAAVAVARCAGDDARIKWPNDVLVDGRKIAGILAEGRPQDGWVVLGMGVNVAVRPDDLPPEVRDVAGTLGRRRADLEPFLHELLATLEDVLALDPDALLTEYRPRDALLGRTITWERGTGTADGISPTGRLRVALVDGGLAELDAGEVHLGTRAASG